MINPFKHAASNVSILYRDAQGSDCAPGQAKAAVIVIAPAVFAVSLVTAFFRKS